jgi:hypothetical protein
MELSGLGVQYIADNPLYGGGSVGNRGEGTSGEGVIAVERVGVMLRVFLLVVRLILIKQIEVVSFL